MKTVVNKLSVASTSALVLLNTKSLFEAGWGREYLSHIDFSQVEKMSEELGSAGPLFGDILLLRKKMIRYLVRQLMMQRTYQQVCILAAGLDPLGLQIAESYPEQLKGIYEVDNAHMKEKRDIYKLISYNDKRLQHVEADVTNTQQLMEALISAGYDPQLPTLIIFEGIIHYIQEEQFLRTMRVFCSRIRNNAVVMEYLIHNDDIPVAFHPTMEKMQEIMEKNIGTRVRQYSRKKMLNLLSLLEAEIEGAYDLPTAEYLLNGQNRHFHNNGDGAVELIAFYI